VQQLERLQRGDTALLARVRREARAQQDLAKPAPFVELIPDASESAAVLEVRASDRAGLLYALGRAITGQRLSIRSAHVSTLAGQAIDTFYVTEVDGSKPTDDSAHRAGRALLEAAGAAATAPA
ncbi:MAG TPA: hypothetical protein VF635_08910, partial [Propionibacteriaceae bacterium]